MQYYPISQTMAGAEPLRAASSRAASRHIASHSKYVSSEGSYTLDVIL